MATIRCRHGDSEHQSVFLHGSSESIIHNMLNMFPDEGQSVMR